MSTSTGLIKLRYAGRCATCTVDLPVGVTARWDRASRTATCADCVRPTTADIGRPPTCGVAGGSARVNSRAERAANERRRRDEIARRREEDERTRQRHRYVGGLSVALRGLTQPRPGVDVAPGSWEKGAVAEEGLGRLLDDLAPTGYPVLHDRRKPGTRYNIDHLVVAPDGVWIIDMKNYTGQLERRATGTILRPDSDLYVGGRRRTALVEKMAWQTETVRTAVGDVLIGHGGAIRPVLCFVGVTMPVWQRPFTIGGVLVTWPDAVLSTIRASRGPLTSAAGRDIADRLARNLPPGT